MLTKNRRLMDYLTKMNIQTRMRVVLLWLSVVPMAIVLLLFYGNSYRDIQAKMENALLQEVELKAMNVETLVEQYQNLLISIVMSDRLQEDFRNIDHMDEAQKIAARNGIEGYLFNIINSMKQIESIIILPKDGGKPLYSGINNPKTAYENTETYQMFQNSEGSTFWTSENDLFVNPVQNTITIGLNIKNKYDHHAMGALVMVISNEQFDKLGEGKVTDGSAEDLRHYSGILANNDNPIWMNEIFQGAFLDDSTPNNDFPALFIEGIRTVYLLNHKRMMLGVGKTKEGFSVVTLVSYAEMMRETHVFMVLSSMIVLAFAGVSFWLSSALTKSIAKPIHDVVASMRRVEEGDLTVQMDEHHEDEFLSISHGFNRMVQNMDELLKDAERSHREVRESELKALQAQINPHFLYNTLDSINWMANAIGADKISLMVTSLAKLFRLSLNKGKDETTLLKEFEHLRSYITISQQRFADKFTVVYQIDEEIYACITIKLILQPIVENSIYHGIEQKQGMGTITIHGHRMAEDVILEIVDDGVGMSEEKLLHIYSDKNTKQNESGYALINVYQRLSLYYGNRFDMKIHSTIGVGTTVTIRFPFKEGLSE